MPAVIERVDRRIAALYRGADLRPMSAGAGDGTGASLQEKETDILRRDDAETIAETLAEVSRLVIEWHFGNGVMPLARVELVVPVQEDSSQVVTAATLLADRGAKVSTSALMDRLNLPKAVDEGDALGGAKVQDFKTQESRKEVENSSSDSQLSTQDPQLLALRAALTADLQPLGEALAGALQAGDLPAMQAALRKISANMPELAGDAANLAEVLAGEFADAFLGETQDGKTQDARQEVENAGNTDGARKGWETRRANGWVAAPKLITAEQADQELDKGFFVANHQGEKNPVRRGVEAQAR